MKERLSKFIHWAGFVFGIICIISVEAYPYINYFWGGVILIVGSYGLRYILTGRSKFFPWGK